MLSHLGQPISRYIISFRLREKRIVVAVEGKNRNVVYLMPPLCFTKQNANDFVEALDDIICDLDPEVLEVKVTPPHPVKIVNGNNK